MTNVLNAEVKISKVIVFTNHYPVSQNDMTSILNTFQDQYGWWFSKSSKSFDAHEDTNCDLGFQESVELIENTLRYIFKKK